MLLDVMACWREVREVLTLSVVNPTKTPRTIRLDAGTLELPETARLFLVAGDDPRACNVPGEPPGRRRPRNRGRPVRQRSDGPAH